MALFDTYLAAAVHAAGQVKRHVACVTRRANRTIRGTAIVHRTVKVAR